MRPCGKAARWRQLNLILISKAPGPNVSIKTNGFAAGGALKRLSDSPLFRGLDGFRTDILRNPVREAAFTDGSRECRSLSVSGEMEDGGQRPEAAALAKINRKLLFSYTVMFQLCSRSFSPKGNKPLNLPETRTPSIVKLEHRATTRSAEGAHQSPAPQRWPGRDRLTPSLKAVTCPPEKPASCPS
jgi:hypothetical protein